MIKKRNLILTSIPEHLRDGAMRKLRMPFLICHQSYQRRSGTNSKASFICTLMLLLCFSALFFTGCGREKKKASVSLTVWSSAREEALTREAVRNFVRIHRKEANLEIEIQTAEVDNMKKKLMDNPKKSADVFSLASDQYTDLKNAGLLAPVSYETDKAIQESGGSGASIVAAVSQYSSLYAYPATNSNGYFLYYNKKYFKPKDVKTLDRILKIAKKNKKYFSMDWTSGWYLYSFFAAAGKTIEVNSTGTANTCDFNSTKGSYSGVDVVRAMLKIARHPGFQSVASDNLQNTMKKGKIIAVVNGTWNAQYFTDLWGKNCGAVKLPTYTLKGSQVQMGSFSGYKYFGVNGHSKHPHWASMLARWLTTYKYQMRRYRTTGECPANTEAAASYKVQISAPIAALNQQNAYATVQNVLDNYWDAMMQFGEIIAEGNPEKENLQELLDRTVESIEAPTDKSD